MAKKTKAKAKSASKAPKSRPATQADAQIVMHLYDQRTNEQMRKARKFLLLEWFPNNFDEFVQVAMAFGTEKQQHLRQAGSYWEQACALANRGAVHEELFVDWAGEAFVLYAKFEPFVQQFRQFNPNFLKNVEKLVTATEERRQRVKMVQTNFIPRIAAAAGAKPPAAAHAS